MKIIIGAIIIAAGIGSAGLLAPKHHSIPAVEHSELLASKEITGRVTDDKANPIAGVTVTVKGTSISTTTHKDGKFKISISNKNKTLVFYAIGYESKEVIIPSGNELNIVLKPSGSETELAEVIAPGTLTKWATQSPPYGYNNNIPKFSSRKEDYNREGYSSINENEFHKVTDEPLSTFSIDVDGASYSNVRRYLNNNSLPPNSFTSTLRASFRPSMYAWLPLPLLASCCILLS